MPFAPYDRAMLDAHSLSAVADLVLSTLANVFFVISIKHLTFIAALKTIIAVIRQAAVYVYMWATSAYKTNDY